MNFWLAPGNSDELLPAILPVRIHPTACKRTYIAPTAQQCLHMPLWTSSLRRLACSCSDKQRSYQPRTRLQWLHTRHLTRNYSTAVAQNQPHEEHDPLSATYGGERHESSHLNAGLLNGRTQRGVKNREVAGDPSRASAEDAPSIAQRSTAWIPFRKRKRVSERPPLFTSRLDRSNLGTKNRPAKLARYGLRATRSPRRVTSRARPSASRKPIPQYSNLAYKAREKLHRAVKQWEKLPVLDIRAFRWAEQVLDYLDHGNEVLRQGDIKSFRHARIGWSNIWSEVALWIINYEPTRMVDFFRATHAEPYVRQTSISAALLLLVRRLFTLQEPERLKQIGYVADAFCVLADRRGLIRQSISKSTVKELLQYCSDDKVHQIYRAIKEHDVWVTHDTHLRFATHFAKNNRFEMALSALIDARDAGADIDGYAFRSNCSTLLRRSSLEPDGLRVCLRVVSELVEMGVNLDNRICNIIMLNAVEAGDMKTAFSVYHSLKEHGLRPDGRTFSVLLQGCRLNIDDVEMLNDIIRDAIANVNVRNNEIVATQILHCLALHHSKNNPENALHILTEAYAQLFDLTPLQPLGLPISNVSEQRMSAEDLMPPTPHAIGFMIGASTQHILTKGGKPKDILPIYERWREQVEAGHPLLAGLATTDHIANIFLVAFIRYPWSLVQAARVVRDMQRSLPPAAGVEQSKPTVQTWSIFLHGFSRHGKHELAEQVLKYMRSKGIEPNLVTWNTLTTGYARAQDLGKTLHALRRSEDAGLVWDVWTYRGLSAFRERQRLQEELRKGRLAESLDFTRDLKEGIGERLGKAEVVVGTADAAHEQPGPWQPEPNVAEEEDYGDSAGELAERDGAGIAQQSYVPFNQ